MNAGKVFSATLGDYTLDLKTKKKVFFHDDPELDPIFNNFSRKVLGAKADITVGPTEVIVSGSATKGKFSTFAFQGIDAVQGHIGCREKMASEIYYYCWHGTCLYRWFAPCSRRVK